MANQTWKKDGKDQPAKESGGVAVAHASVRAVKGEERVVILLQRAGKNIK